MPTRKTPISVQQTYELVGQVVGLQGDPANQDDTNGGFNISTVTGDENTYQFFTWSEADLASMAAVLFWSRVLLVEILQPYDSSLTFPKLTLVLRPRSHWLFQVNSTDVADFAGNQISITDLALPGQSTITPVTPIYNIGDYIRLGLLPAPVTLSNWNENITARNSELYPGGDTSAMDTRSPALAISNLSIRGNSYAPSAGFGTFNPTQIIYYDKNIDARGRISPGDSGATVDVNVCIGGVVHVYRLKGSQLS